MWILRMLWDITNQADPFLALDVGAELSSTASVPSQIFAGETLEIFIAASVLALSTKVLRAS